MLVLIIVLREPSDTTDIAKISDFKVFDEPLIDPNKQKTMELSTITYDDTYMIQRIQRLFHQLAIKNVVVWGHPLHSHTHSYIHDAFVRAAKRLGIDTYWVPQHTYDDQNKILFKYTGPKDKCLFITEGQVVDDIPQSDQSWYIMHNVTNRVDLANIPKSRQITLQFYTLGTNDYTLPLFDNFQRLEMDSLNCVYMPWGTNLLPYEFKPLVNYRDNPAEVCIVGQNGEVYAKQIHKFFQALEEHGYILNHKPVTGMSDEDMIQLIRSAQCSPAIIHEWQKEHGYIPCRIMKNISYGQLPVTNSMESDYMLHHNTISDYDEVQLAHKFLELSQEAAERKRELAYRLIQQRHTYLNRLELLTMGLKLKRDWIILNDGIYHRNDEKSLRVLHITCHTGCIKYINYVAQRLNWSISTLNMLKEHGATVHNMTQSRAQRYWGLYKNEINASDLVIVSDTAPLARIILEHLPEFTSNLIVWVCNRFDYHHSALGEPPQEDPFPDQGWYDLINRVNSEKVKIISYTKIERMYALDKNVIWDGPFADLVVKPVGGVISTPEKSAFNLTNKSDYLFIPPYLNDEKLIDYDFLEQKNIKYVKGRYNGPDDLIGFKAILHIPYAASNLALFENLARGIVYYIPSETFQRELLLQHPWFSGGIDRMGASEWYDRKMQHLFVYFDSWSDLKNKLENNAHFGLIEITKTWAAKEERRNLSLWNILSYEWW